ncbi:MAG: hypothetical protein CMN29_14190 [Sandaracinus sp.]|nr:hypothetical protein [Sandaracinus sp.]HJL22380.1 hypothetical protein [Polyangiaceae bacterium LLY-WYZ-15_(1-7)]
MNGDDDKKLHPTMVLRRRSDDDRFELVFRWWMGTTERLPRDGDRFRITVREQKRGRRLSAAGEFVEDPHAHILVAPMRMTMADPPRRAQRIPLPGATDQWLVAERPKGPVDCAAADDGTLARGDRTEALGICHLLAESDHSRVRWRVATMLEHGLRQAVAHNQAEGLAARFLSPEVIRASARRIASRIVADETRPLDLPQVATRAYRALADRTSRVAENADPLGFFAPFDGAPLVAEWELAAALMRTLTDESLIQELDRTVTGASQARQHIQLTALTGGELIDYWGDPTDVRVHEAATVMGLGFRVGSFSDALVKGWESDQLHMTVEHLPAERFEPQSGPGNLHDPTVDPPDLEPGEAVLFQAEARLAREVGTSRPILPPRLARVSFDLLQTNAGCSPSELKEHGEYLAYGTGDGRIELVIAPDRHPAYDWIPSLDSDGVRTSFGFNIYGVWEGASEATDRFFLKPDLEPSLDELRPFLLTRRYSYRRDLEGGLAEGDMTRARVLSHPPSRPVLARPDASYDAAAEAREEAPGLPDDHHIDPETGERLTTWSFDLRTGMRFGGEPPPGYWDPGAVAELRWTPELDRVGQACADRPQRYRFWVTAVDFFNQESAPAPVHTHDEDAGEREGVVFEPRYRAPLGPPPRDAIDTRSSSFSLANDEGGLLLSFEAPFQSKVGGRIGTSESSSVTDRVRTNHLVATARLFRRRLTRKVEEPPLHSLDLEELEPWESAVAELNAESYRQVGDDYRVPRPPKGHTWTLRIPVEGVDPGFEYVAAVGFHIDESARAFWTGAATLNGPCGGRRAQVILRTDEGEYAPSTRRVSELPWASEIAVTDAVPIPDPARPRAPRLQASDCSFSAARPVLAPPRMERDLLLMKLMSRGFSRAGLPLEPTLWRDTGVKLSLGQTAMCESALERSAADPSDPALGVARAMLARDFVEEREGTDYRQNQTVGFRGLQKLVWSYSPIVDRRLVDESDAVHFRVDGARIARGASAPSLRAEAHHMGDGRYRASWVEGDDVLTSLVANERLACVRVMLEGIEVLVGSLANASRSGRDVEFQITPRSADVSWPEQAELHFFVSQPLATIDIKSYQAPTRYEVSLPVGGGPAELFVYWVVSVSAQGVQSSAASSPAVYLDVRASIAPTPPSSLRAFSPGPTGPALDPVEHSAHCPTAIDSEDSARFSPRVVLTWRGLADEHLYVEVSREQRQAARVEPPGLSHWVLSPWKALREIEQAAAGARLRAEALDVLRDGWLLGSTVVVDDEQADARGLLIGAAAQLSASDGLVTVGEDGTPAFVDYFRHLPPDRERAMDGNWEYRYQAAFALDLDPSGATPDEWRYLSSRPTGWTDWILARTPPIVASAGPSDLKLVDGIVPPRVRVRVVTTQRNALRHLAVADSTVAGRWRYRIVLQRLVELPLSQGEPAFTWIDVGRPASVLPDDHVGIEIIDDDLERSTPHETLRLRYRALCCQYVSRSGVDGTTTEAVMRMAPEPEEFDLEVCPMQDGREVELTCVLHVA